MKLPTKSPYFETNETPFLRPVSLVTRTGLLLMRPSTYYRAVIQNITSKMRTTFTTVHWMPKIGWVVYPIMTSLNYDQRAKSSTQKERP